jgi:hypothetical protein
MPPTSTEFVQHVVAGLQTGSLPATPHVQPAPPNPQPAETPVNCHSERSEERPAIGASPESYREEPAFSASRAGHSSLITRHFPKPKDHRLCRLPNFPSTSPVIPFVPWRPPSIPPHQPPPSPIPFPQPNPLGRWCQPPSPTTHRRPAHPLRNLPQIGTPAHSTSTTTTASA